jgi:hypothetical protein
MSLLARIFRCAILGLVLLAASAIAVAQDSKKFEYAILVDSTGSMRSQFDQVIALAREIVNQIHEHGPVSIYRFHSERIGRPSRAIPTRIIEQTQEKGQLNRALDNIYIEGGQTTLLDAVDLMVNHLNEPPTAAKKVIILITDGEDRVSKTKRKELFEKLAASKTHIYAIGLVRELEGGKRSKASSLLESLAKESGGQVVFLKTDRPDLQKLLSELAIPIQ